jgi:nucleoside-diphosphate-sugar epimerase
MILEAAQSRSELRFVEWKNADVELRVPDIKKAEDQLGFRARVDLDVGLKRTLDWYRQKMGL